MKINIKGAEATNTIKLNNVKPKIPAIPIKPQKPIEEPKEEHEEQPIDEVVETPEDAKNDVEELTEDPEISEDRQKMIKKRYKALKIRKILLLSVTIFVMVCVFIFSMYGTFFKHTYTGYEIASLSNKYNGTTNFPTEGVQGYLSSNLSSLMKDKVTVGPNVENVTFTDPVVTAIYRKSDAISNIYFYFDMNSNKGTSQVNAMIPLSYDFDKYMYNPAGNVIFAITKQSNASTKSVDNPFLSFKDANKADDASNAEAKIFCDNFFKLLYTGGDISPYYQGDPLSASGLTYDSLDNFQYYTSSNTNGYNVYAQVSLTTESGITYQTVKYLNISSTTVNGKKSWTINQIL